MRRLLFLVTTMLVASTLPASASFVGEPLELPNLVPMTPWEVELDEADRGTGSRALRFSVTTVNEGDFALELLGLPPSSVERAPAEQCVSWTGRVCLERRRVGEFVFHPSHRHWHIDDYALYELRSLTAEGTPNMTDAGLVASGGKVSFCLLDTDRTEGAPFVFEDPFWATGYYVLCTGAFQGISAGWGDTYSAQLPGQQIVIDNVADGTYAIVVTVNPDGFLLETSQDDNLAYRAVRLSSSGTGLVVLD